MTGPSRRDPAAVRARLLERLEAVAARLDDYSLSRGRPDRLTPADPELGERWDGGQVWAHMTEFPAYWVEQVRLILGSGPDPVDFGRTKIDPGRVASIARDRDIDIEVLAGRVRVGVAAIADLLGDMDGAAWHRSGRHPTIGEMSMERIIDEFLVGHLEQHADQLELLRIAGPETDPHSPAGSDT